MEHTPQKVTDQLIIYPRTQQLAAKCMQEYMDMHSPSSLTPSRLHLLIASTDSVDIEIMQNYHLREEDIRSIRPRSLEETFTDYFRERHQELTRNKKDASPITDLEKEMLVDLLYPHNEEMINQETAHRLPDKKYIQCIGLLTSKPQSKLKKLAPYGIAVTGTTLALLAGRQIISKIYPEPTPTPIPTLSEEDVLTQGLGAQANEPTPTPHPTNTVTPNRTPDKIPTSFPTPLPELSIKELEALQNLYELVENNRDVRSSEDPDYARRTDKELNENRINVCMIGLDEDDTSYVHHADAVMIASLNIKTGAVDIMRIPRDLHAPEVDELATAADKNWEGWSFRINGMTFWGDISDTRRILENATGLSQDFCFRWNKKGFVSYVDALGGFDVELSEEFVNNYKRDFKANTGFKIRVGVNHFDGEVLHYFARVREHDTDFDRGKRQQLVFELMIQRMLQMAKTDQLGLTSFFFNTVQKQNDQQNAMFASETSLTDLISFTLQEKDTLGNFELKDFSIRYYDPGWQDLLTRDLLKSAPDMLFIKGQDWINPKNQLEYWQLLRDKIRQDFLETTQQKKYAIPDKRAPRFQENISPTIINRFNPKTGWTEPFDITTNSFISLSPLEGGQGWSQIGTGAPIKEIPKPINRDKTKEQNDTRLAKLRNKGFSKKERASVNRNLKIQAQRANTRF